MSLPLSIILDPLFNKYQIVGPILQTIYAYYPNIGFPIIKLKFNATKSKASINRADSSWGILTTKHLQYHELEEGRYTGRK